MFKTWQIFVFSLVPLALVFAGVFIGSIHGSDSEREVFPTPAPAATPRSLAAPGLEAAPDIMPSRHWSQGGPSLSQSTLLTMNDQGASVSETIALSHATQDCEPHLRS